MRLINKMERYLNDLDYKITIKDNQIDILNYEEIIDFSPTKISVKYKNIIFIIEGLHLAIQKMLDDEVLISGNITNVSIK